MRILTVRSTLPDMGPGTQPLTIAKQMRERGHSVSFATSGGSYTPSVEEAGFELSIIPEMAPDKHDPLSVMRGIQKLMAVIERQKPDVVHGHNATATISAYIAGRLKGRRLPCVTSVRGVEERPTHQWRNQIWKRTPGILLGVCEKTRERLISFGALSDKIAVTYNGVDIDQYRRGGLDGASVRKKFGLENKIVVGTTGAMTGPEELAGPSKGQHNLVKAVGKLKDKHPSLSVLLVGDGHNRHKVEAAAKDCGIEDRVVFAGRRFDVPEMLSAMDIYCLASIYGEFFPNSIVEAMSMELPWIGSDIAGLKELTANNKAGWVTAIDDVNALAKNLDRLVSSEKLRKERGATARKEVEEKFTIEKVTDRIVNAYHCAGVSKEKVSDASPEQANLAQSGQ